MKKIINKPALIRFSIKNLIFILLVLYHQNLTAQQLLPCGDYKIDRTALQRALEYEKNNQNSKQVGNYLARVYFHIVADDDGTKVSATVAQVNSEYATLVTDYAGDGICFINAGYDIVKNTKLNSQFNANTDNPALFNPYRVPNCINVFFPTQLLGTNPSCTTGCGIGGTSFTVPSTFCLVSASSNLGIHATSHEVGHCFGLLHTFETANGLEDIDGSNSATTADAIPDTPADPYAFNSLGRSCYTVSGCLYTGTCTDPKGRNDYTPPYINMMSYWPSRSCYTSPFFSANQFTRINSFLNIVPDLQVCLSAYDVTQGSISMTSGYLMASGRNSLTTSGTVNLTGASVATLGGGIVYLEPGFHAQPNTSGIIQIEGANCNDVATARATLLVSKPDDIKVDENTFTVYPNPSTGVVHLVINAKQGEKDIHAYVYNVLGVKVKEVALTNQTTGSINLILNLAALPAGLYDLIITSSLRKEHKKIVIAR